MSRPTLTFTKTLRHIHTTASTSRPTSQSPWASLVETVIDGPPRKIAQNRGAGLLDTFPLGGAGSGGRGSRFGGGGGGGSSSSSSGMDNARRGGELLDGFARSSRGNGESSVGAVPFEGQKLRAPHEYLPTTRFPHLSSSPAKRYAKPPLLGPPASLARQIDPFHILETSPLKYDLNPYVAQQFVNDLGKIKSRAETGLTWKSQRQVGKLVRRARSMGLIGRWSKLAPVGGLGFNRRSY